MIFWEIAKRNLRIHLLRSFLAMLGIVIGVVAISTMGILGNSMVLSVSDSLRTVGDSVIVTPHAAAEAMGFGGGSGHDLVHHIGAGIPADQTRLCTQYRNTRSPDLGTDETRALASDEIVALVYGLNPDDVPSMLKLQEGDYNRGNSGCLVGATFAKDNNVKVGSRISHGKRRREGDAAGHRHHRGAGNGVRCQHGLGGCCYPGLV